MLIITSRLIVTSKEDETINPTHVGKEYSFIHSFIHSFIEKHEKIKQEKIVVTKI